jgi:signal transduction histidine kinase
MKSHSILYRLLGLITKFFIFLIKLIAVLIGREILMRKRTEARSKAMAHHEAQRHMNEFLSVASHELKTPLTSIKGNVQLMGRRLRSESSLDTTRPEEVQHVLGEARELLERTDQQLTRLTQLVNIFLESARINGNTMDLLFELCELDTIIRETLQNPRYMSSSRTVQLELPTENTVLVMADASRIKQVIIQYLSNAHKYSHLDLPIKIALKEEGRMVRVSVQDQGHGIPISEQKRIWERFYRISDTQVLNGSEVGLGLGLHICRTIIEQHHGQVGLQSEPGQGTTFWFLLPLMERKPDSTF